MRTTGSVRHDDYYKTQKWDPTSIAWVDIQTAHPTQSDAIGACRQPGRYRIVTVTETGRTFGEPFDRAS